MATTTQTTVDTLNSLLRGQLSAIETYRQAEEKFSGESEAGKLRQLREEHIESANSLREHVHAKGGKPSTDSGAWGSFAKLVEGTAKLFGKTAALKALKEGEEHGVNDYESALKDNELPAECQTLIREKLLPKCRKHISTLDSLMSQQ